jgi:bla regulator protein blaR1
MSHITQLGNGIFQWVLHTTWQAAVLAGLILLAQQMLRKRMPPSWRYGLWLLLVIRLLMPLSPPSALSIFNLAKTAPTSRGAANPARSLSFSAPPGTIISINESPARQVTDIRDSSSDTAPAPLRVANPPARKVDWLTVAFCGWLAGVVFFGVRLVWTNWRFHARISRHQPVADENVQRLFNECRAVFNIRRPVRLIESEEVESPAVYGLWRKWLLLPDGVFEHFSTEELRCIFLHELAHIKRGDLGVNWLVAVLQALHWFNPVLWLAWARMRADRELATDALALTRIRQTDHQPYGETILKVLDGLTCKRALPGLVGILENKAQLKERLTAISRPRRYWRWAALATVVLIAGVGLTGAQSGKDASSTPEPQTPPATAPTITLRGRVVDAKGAPIAGAAIQARGIMKKDGTGRWGAIRVIDPAVSDGQGRFVLISKEPFDSLGVWVDARGFAPKAFKKLNNDGQEHELVMTEGASLKGRVLYQGKALANISVAATRADGEVGEYHGHFEAKTDAEGKFTFLNLPPTVEYAVSGQMSSLQNYGATSATRAVTGSDGSTTEVGDLTVQPAFRIGGRVSLSDSQPMPPETKLTVSSQGAGSLSVALDKDGQFTLGGIPTGKTRLSIQVPGYHWSLKNASLDQLNPGSLVGLVDHDITNLVLLLDKGPRLKSHFDGLADSGPQPEFNALSGIENGGARLSLKQISGRVTDATTGAAISRFRVTPGQWDNMMMNLDWNPNLAVEGSNGNYVVELGNRPGAVQLKFEAEGYLPAASPAFTGDKDHCDFSLAKGSGPSGTVLLPDGRPAAGVKILLTGPQPQNSGLLCLVGGGNFQNLEDKALETTTDADGRFSLAPQLEMKQVAAAGSAGFKLVTVESLRTNAQITLEPWGSIKGILRRPSGPGANEALAVGFAGELDVHALVLSIRARTDEKGAFDFDHVPPGDCKIETSVSVGEDAADIEHLKSVHVPPGQTVEVDIEAPAKGKPILLGRPGERNDLSPVKSSLSGKVLLPDGKPAMAAQVGLKNPMQNLHVGDGELVAGPMNDSVVRTEGDGSFTVPMRDTATALYAVSEAGYAKVPPESWTNGVKIILQPWGRVEGTLRRNHRPAPNERVELSENNEFGGGFAQGGFRATTITDDQGRFAFAHVPPGKEQIWRSVPYGNNGWMSSDPMSFSVRSGETTNVTYGGDGRPVLGECVVENQKDVPENPIWMVSINGVYPSSPGINRNAVQITSARQRSFNAMVAADGSFQVDDVAPGTYDLEFTIQGGAQRPRDMIRLTSQPKRIIVPPLSDPEKCEPVDLGALSTSFIIQNIRPRQQQPNSQTLKAGDTAPAIETTDLSGQPLRLNDYRGKFVLLDLRYMLPGMEMDGLKSLNNTFGHDDRFVLISLCQTADADFLKTLSVAGATHWIQGHLDFDALGAPYGLSDAEFPLIMLIDPQGKIVATGLRGAAIQSTVTKALAEK